jgi:hypothetical protein
MDKEKRFPFFQCLSIPCFLCGYVSHTVFDEGEVESLQDVFFSKIVRGSSKNSKMMI